MSIKIGNQILAKSSTYHPDLFDVKWADHILNNASWLRADTFSWQSGKIFQRAYQHLVSDLGERTTTTYYGWTNTSDSTIYTTTENPQEGDIIYRGTPLTQYLVIDNTIEATELFIRVENTVEGFYSRDLSADFVEVNTESETIAGITIQYSQAKDGHKIVTPDQEENIFELYRKTGIAWYYIVDTQNQQFKLPRTKFAFVGVDDQVGKYVKPGLPNITGAWTSQYNISLDNNSNCIGAIASTYSTGQGLYGGSNASSDWGYGFNFNASKSNSIYGASTTVQAPSTQMYLYFYIGDSTQTALENTAGINQELFNGKADITDLNRATEHVVIEYQEPTSENNYTWYRKYADGWIEQGGQFSNSSRLTTINLLQPMANTKYYVSVMLLHCDSGWTATVNAGVQNGTRTTTSFVAQVWYNNSNTTGLNCWEVKGIAA